MKTITKLLSVLLIASLSFSCSSDSEGDETGGDPIIGKWKQMSATENGVALTLDSCDLQEEAEFKNDGVFLSLDYDLVDGECILNDPNEPGLTIETKWVNVATNSYKVNFYINGQISPYALEFTTVFSNNNNTVTTTATEEDGDIVVSVMNKI